MHWLNKDTLRFQCVFFCIKAATLLHIHTGVTFDCGLLLTEHVPVAQGLTVTCDSRVYSRQQPVAFSRFLLVGRRAACGWNMNYSACQWQMWAGSQIWQAANPSGRKNAADSAATHTLTVYTARHTCKLKVPVESRDHKIDMFSVHLHVVHVVPSH